MRNPLFSQNFHELHSGDKSQETLVRGREKGGSMDMEINRGVYCLKGIIVEEELAPELRGWIKPEKLTFIGINRRILK